MRGFFQLSIRDRGKTPRGMRRAFREASKRAWYDTAMMFHTHLRDLRFTEAHARAAGYIRRKGELLPRGSKAYRRSYTGIKERRFGHTRPLEFTGQTRQNVKMVNITSTSNGGKAAYRGASKFSFRPPKSQIQMSEEFKRLLPEEMEQLAQFYDQQLDFYWGLVAEEQSP